MRRRAFEAAKAGLEEAAAYARGDTALLVSEPGEGPVMRYIDGRLANTVENLRQLLTEIYVSGSIREGLPDGEWDRIHTAILDAAEGRPFMPLGLPFPRSPA